MTRNNAFAVRAAAEKDIQYIIEIAGETISPSWTYEYIRDALGKDDTLILVAESSGSVTGFASFRQVGDDGELLQIAVAPAAQRCGAGSRLLAAVLGYAAKSGLNSVFLEVRAGNNAAIALYKKHNFKQLRIRKAYYSGPVEDALVMIKSMKGMQFE